MASAPPMTARNTELASVEQLKEAWLRNESVESGDPTLARVPLPHARSYSPLGFPLLLESNSEEVHACAAESWGKFHSLFRRQPIRLSVLVSDDGDDTRPDPPVCRMRDHVVVSVADAANFATVDLERGAAFISVTWATIRDSEYFRYFFLESSAMALLANREATGVHAACVEWDGTGMLLCGDSGAGKSTLAYACATAGFTYVTDDGSYLLLGETDPVVVGNCHHVRFRPDAVRFFSELAMRKPMLRAGVGKPTLELPVAGEISVRTSPVARVGRVVFLKRGAQRQELVTFPTEVARMYFAQRVHCMPWAQQKHLANIDRLVDIETVELRYHELDWAVHRLRLLASEGR